MTTSSSPIDDHTGWTCEAGASLIADAMTPGPGVLGVLHAVIYVCPEHSAPAETLITVAGYTPEVRPAPASHQHDPWPCGHITAYDAQAAAELAAARSQQAARIDQCAACQRPFDPSDTRWDGHNRSGNTDWCRACVDRCHDNDSADHRCRVCA